MAPVAREARNCPLLWLALHGTRPDRRPNVINALPPLDRRPLQPARGTQHERSTREGEELDRLGEIVLTALVTSSIVALTVEYVAKPRLEVRTHRTVEMVRVRQELVGTLISVTFSAIVAGEMLPGDLDDENRATFSAEQDRHYLRMQQACRDLFDDAGRYLAVFPGSSAEALIMDGISTLYGVVMSPRPRARQVELVHGQTLGRYQRAGQRGSRLFSMCCSMTSW